MSNTVVNYETILNIVREELEVIRRSNSKFSNIKLIVADERLLAKEKDRSPDTIYIQVKFGAASTNFGQAVLPFSMEVLGINQDVELTQDLLNEFVNTYNRVSYDNTTQFYLTPVVSQNNIPVYEGFRSLFIISSTFVISNQLVRLTTLQYKVGEGEYEDIEVLSYSDSSTAQLNPQPYPNRIGRTKSYGTFQSFAFSIVTYPNSEKQLVKDLFEWKFSSTTTQSNRTFIFSGSFSNIESGFEDWEFKCNNVDFSFRVGENSVINATFTL